MSDTLTYDEFANYLNNHLAEKIPAEYTPVNVHLHDKVMGNDKKVDLLVIQSSKSSIAPSFYVDGLYEEYLTRSMTMDDLMDKIAEQYGRELKQMQANDHVVDAIWDFNLIKHQIMPRLVNRSMSQDFLEHKVSYPIEDLAMTFYINLGEAVVHITEGLLNKWNITAETLKTTALSNLTPQTVGLVKVWEYISPFMDPFEGMDDETREICKKLPLYTIVTRHGHYGAAGILCKELMDSLCKMFDENVLIIPSSSDEVIVMPESMGDADLSALIPQVNRTEVEDDKVLADHPYCYSINNGLCSL